MRESMMREGTMQESMMHEGRCVRVRCAKGALRLEGGERYETEYEL